MNITYKTKATADGGRAGRVVNEEAGLTLDMAIPGSGAKGNNPEQLFAMGYAACFDSALKFSAKRERKPLSGSRTTAEIGLGQKDDGTYGLDVDLYIVVMGLGLAEAEKLVAVAHAVCPYSNALRGNVEIRLHVTVE